MAVSNAALSKAAAQDDLHNPSATAVTASATRTHMPDVRNMLAFVYPQNAGEPNISVLSNACEKVFPHDLIGRCSQTKHTLE
jgi:hypothetical protein